MVRNGQNQEINTSAIVVGDVMLLEMGDILPADGLLFEGNDIRWAAVYSNLCIILMLCSFCK